MVKPILGSLSDNARSYIKELELNCSRYEREIPKLKDLLSRIHTIRSLWLPPYEDAETDPSGETAVLYQMDAEIVEAVRGAKCVQQGEDKLSKIDVNPYRA